MGKERSHSQGMIHRSRFKKNITNLAGSKAHKDEEVHQRVACFVNRNQKRLHLLERMSLEMFFNERCDVQLWMPPEICKVTDFLVHMYCRIFLAPDPAKDEYDI